MNDGIPSNFPDPAENLTGAVWQGDYSLSLGIDLIRATGSACFVFASR